MPEEIADPERLVREVTFAVEGDGRTIEARIVPYNTPTEVMDSPRNGGTGERYLERWAPGAFDKQTGAAHRVPVWLNVEHEKGFRAVVGHGVMLREAPDALYGTFRVEPGSDGDKALHMVNEGVLTELSIEAIPRKSRRTMDGIVERMKATLDAVALVRGGRAAYLESQVLAVREAPEVIEPPVANETDETLERLGFSRLPTAVSKRPWNPARTRFTDEQWEASCVGGLPILEPSGEINVEAVTRAAAQIGTVSLSERGEVARKLVRCYRRTGLDVPTSLRKHATR